ncbi:cation-translocating P-type ATPase [Nevskia soli]|uniref:cation-translocating P-type ATPase n=1 Tax=Nevskia soli TaxID=418856 RepID=UPI0009FC07A1|nr:cation-translocating P-type ATPase [Nevskia soli]
MSVPGAPTSSASGAAEPKPRSLGGLSAEEAEERLREDGYNELPRQQRRSLLKVVVEVFREPMFSLLIAAGLVYLALGDLGEALLLVVFATMSVVITIVQQSRTERALEALRDLSSPRALVIRDGRQQRIAGRDVVRGDLVILEEGDRVPADAMVISALDLAADESLLTGESVPVSKGAARQLTEAPRPGGDGLPYVFSGSLVVRGRGLAEVRATGLRSEIGKIGVLLSQVREEATPLSSQLRKLVRILAATGMGVSAAVVLLYGLAKGAWLQGILAGTALAMSLLPEEVPLVLTVFLALGARRIAERQVLSRRAASIEALGAATVLCADKTGTLTLNRMLVAELRVGDASCVIANGQALPAAFEQLARRGAMACAAQPTDPMDKAIVELAGPVAVGHLVHEYPLSPDLLAMSQVWKRTGESRCIVATKGAPEAVADLCGIDEAERVRLRASLEDMAGRGLRVIAVAEASFDGEQWPESQHDFSHRFLGLVGLADPVRPTVPQAIKDCRAAGIRVVMVTGDYPATARAISAQAGLDGAGAMLTGADIDGLDDVQLGERMKQVTVCARVMPKHKLRIVEALKRSGEVVAMTGDGVNDAPSLRAAHIGIAMGGRGTDVAREAAAMVLLDDEFGSIVQAMRLGRRIYDNIRKAMAYILAVHVPIAGLALLPLLLGWPVVLGPLHIAFLEFIIDPVCSIVFEAEPEEADVMSRPPRSPGEPLLSGRLIAWSLLQGLLVLVLVFGFHTALIHAGLPEDDVRVITFISLVFSFVILIFINRSFSTPLIEAVRRPNASLWRGLAILVVLLAAVLYIPSLRHLFGFGMLHWDDLLLGGGASAVLLYGLEASKPWLSPLAGRRSARSSADSAPRNP